MKINKLQEHYGSYHCSNPKLINYAKIDTMLCAVFYVRDKKDMNESFIPKLEEYAKKDFTLLQLYDKQKEISQSEYDSKLIQSFI